MQEVLLEITLEQMLQVREERVRIQERIREEYRSTIISFTMNIPGAIKNSNDIWESFNFGAENMRRVLEQYELQEIEVRNLPSGPEGYYVVSGDYNPLKIKEILSGFEESHLIGRWFDMDVKDAKGTPISREEVGFEPRKCFFCNENAKVCGRSRRHSVQELFEYTQKSLMEYVNKKQGNKTA